MSLLGTVVSISPEHWWHWLLACLPFVSVVEGKAKINPTQIIQFLIVAGVGGLVAGYISTVKQEVRIEAIEKSIVKMEYTVAQGFNSIKEDFKDMRKDFYIPNVPRK